MVPRASRLPLGPRVLQSGEALASPYFLLKFQKNKADRNRFGVIVSVRAGKTAVIRHIIKRELLLGAAKWPKHKDYGHDFLFIASPRLGGVPKHEASRILKKELGSITTKLIPHLST